jgi:hypothetical protein
VPTFYLDGEVTLLVFLERGKWKAELLPGALNVVLQMRTRINSHQKVAEARGSSFEIYRASMSESVVLAQRSRHALLMQDGPCVRSREGGREAESQPDAITPQVRKDDLRCLHLGIDQGDLESGQPIT